MQPVTYDKPVMDANGQPVLDEQGKPKTETATATEQVLAVGPAASQIAIKQLGTNGGGFFNVNSAHPFENPTPLSNFLELLAILLIPAALCYTFGMMVGDTRQGWALLAAMTILLIVVSVPLALWAEQSGNPALHGAAASISMASGGQSGGNMEGKETRFGIANSALWATATTAASNGSVNSMHDSFTPLGGLVPLFLMQFGEVVFGGVGSGLYGMLVFAIIAVFVAGLMVGRTPEYLGKKIEAFEMKMASLVILILPIVVFGSRRSPSSRSQATSSRSQSWRPRLQRDSVRLFLSGQQQRQRLCRSECQHAVLQHHRRHRDADLPLLAGDPDAGARRVAGAQKDRAGGPGTLPTHTPLFVALLIGVVIMVGALTFMPALALGPIVEHLLM